MLKTTNTHGFRRSFCAFLWASPSACPSPCAMVAAFILCSQAPKFTEH